MGGKATGREALLAARQAKGDRLHGGALPFNFNLGRKNG